ncbi:AtpZ/AtpI family protein [Methylomarinum vadi]|uniref:AtpZ/AtpI family protein n=1 Tax=Methylomarinum vadi TaxID=438855 RepID=UPI000691C3E5|nr:AtpZ/AtpI family protein [Methylomarinum vadi]
MTKSKQKPAETELTESVDKQAKRKLKARRDGKHNVWFGLGMFGLVGWSVAIPTLAGIALGVWIDKRWPSQISWTLTLMFVGVVLGCLNAWRWIGEESRDD